MIGFMSALALAWAVFAAVIVAIYAYQYARDLADLRKQEQEYADRIMRARYARRYPAKGTPPNRYLRENEGAPE